MRIAALLLLCAAIAIATTDAFAYSKTLTPEDIQAAIEYGKSRKGRDLVDSGSSYYAPLGIGTGFIVILTPWLQVAGTARDAATEYREPTDTEVQATLAEWIGKLSVFAFVMDTRDGFWRNSHGVILQDGKTIQPRAKHSTFRNVVSCYGSSCTYSANIFLVFPDNDLDTSREAEIVIVLAGGYRELRAKVDFGKMR